MTGYAAPAAVATRLMRDLTAAEAGAVPILIEEASARLDIRAPGLAARVAGGDETATTLAEAAVANAVKRVLQNPDGVKTTQWSTTAGPYSGSESRTLDDSHASGALYFTAEDLVGLVDSAVHLPMSARIRSGYRRPHR